MTRVLSSARMFWKAVSTGSMVVVVTMELALVEEDECELLVVLFVYGAIVVLDVDEELLVLLLVDCDTGSSVADEELVLLVVDCEVAALVLNGQTIAVGVITIVVLLCVERARHTRLGRDFPLLVG